MKNNGKRIIVQLRNVKSITPEEIFKETYNFDFLTLDENHTEKEFECALMTNTEKLLLEFGSDFSITGRQRKIIIDGSIHTVDIEFYHRGVPCIVLVDLKIGKFKSEYVGQMNKYCQSHDTECIALPYTSRHIVCLEYILIGIMNTKNIDGKKSLLEL